VRSVLVPLAQGCEELEAVTIIDLLRRAQIEVVTAGLDHDPVKGSRGTVLLPDVTLNQALARDYDMAIEENGRGRPLHRRDLRGAENPGCRRIARRPARDLVPRRD
jgi:hypothetical protein